MSSNVRGVEGKVTYAMASTISSPRTAAMMRKTMAPRIMKTVVTE